MQKIKIRLPATIVNLGPGLQTLGLALSMYTTIEIFPRADDQLIVEPQGEGAGRYAMGLRHPVVLALARVFQRLERAPTGIQIRISNQIPVMSGLGAETAFLLGGVIGANNLMGNPFARDDMLAVAARISRADSAVSAMFGGLSASYLTEDRLMYHTYPVTQLKLLVVVPDLPQYSRPSQLERVPMTAALYNLNRLPLLIEALRMGDLDLIAETVQDALRVPRLVPQIRGYAAALEAARETGAVAVTVAGDGPALVVFTDANHQRIGDAMLSAFEYNDVKARSWVLPIDTQGLTLSVMQSV